jgi:hypothetical protein
VDFFRGDIHRRHYRDAKGHEVLSVVIDAQTGKVQNVFHSKK